MIVIIEGLDGVGKTTICQQICEQYNYQYIKESYTNDYQEKEQRVARMLLRLIDGRDFIYDRTTLIDDFVYEFLNVTESPLTKYYNIITAILSECKIIHLQLDEQTRKQHFEQRGDQYITDKDIEQVRKNYLNFYDHSNLTNVQYVTLTGDLKKDVSNVMEVINEN